MQCYSNSGFYGAIGILDIGGVVVYGIWHTKRQTLGSGANELSKKDQSLISIAPYQQAGSLIDTAGKTDDSDGDVMGRRAGKG